MSSLPVLRGRAGINSLLSSQDANPKVAKNSKLGQLTAVLHLAPGNMSGHEVCPKRSPGCTAACLHFAGNPLYQDAKTKARIAKTKLFFDNRNLFMNILALEITNHILRARKKKMEPSFRLNGTSDICFELKKFILYPETAAIIRKRISKTNLDAKNIINMFPSAQFYDYTALPERVVPPNYHLTFSMKENNLQGVRQAIKSKMNIAVVFPLREIPSAYNIDDIEYQVIRGDDHDYRPADPKSVIVGLKVKGTSGKKDTTGFVQRVPNFSVGENRPGIRSKFSGHDVQSPTVQGQIQKVNQMLEHLNEYFKIMAALNSVGKTQPLMAVGLKAKLDSLAKRTQSQHLRNRISKVLQESVKTTA